MHISFYKRPLLAAFILYALWLAFFLPVPTPEAGDISLRASLELKDAAGVADAYPRQRQNEQIFTMEMQSADNQKAFGRVLAYCKNCPEIRRGQSIIFYGQLQTLERQKNFGGFDYAKYLARKHIFTQLRIEKITDVKNTSRFWGFVSGLRQSILKTFKDNFNTDLLPIISGITLGEKSDISPRLNRAFQDSGAMHLLVASGGNVGFVTLIVYFLCSLLGLKRLARALLALSFALLYTFAAGADAPLTRAYIMTLAATIGFILGRKSGIMQGLVLAAFALLIYNPQSLFEAGFQMSFLATFAIILTACNFNARLSRKMPKRLRFIIQLFLISLAAQLALIPVFTNYFYRLSFAAVFSNILLVPLSGVLMAGGFLLWAVSFIPLGFLSGALVFILTKLLLLFKFLVEFFANTPISHISAGALNIWAIIFYYAALFCLLNLPSFSKKGRQICCLLILIFAAAFTLNINAKKENIIVLEGKYNGTILFNTKDGLCAVGAGVSPQTLKDAVLANGGAKIKCLFLSGLSKSAAYALNDVEDITIEKIFVPYGSLDDILPLLEKAKAEVKMIRSGEEYCSVTAGRAWFLTKEGNISESFSPDVLSYSFSNISTAGNLKSYKKDGRIFKFN